jgi:hypothetical protein
MPRIAYQSSTVWSSKVMAIPAGDPPGRPSVTVTYPVLVTVSVPREFVAMRVTVYVPVSSYVCVGFWSDEVPASPKFQEYDMGMDPVEISVNLTVRGAAPDLLLEVNAATGGAGTSTTVMYPVFTSESLPAPFVTVRVTVNVPGVGYVYVGPASELSTSPSLVKSHAYVNGAVPVDWLVN